MDRAIDITAMVVLGVIAIVLTVELRRLVFDMVAPQARHILRGRRRG